MRAITPRYLRASREHEQSAGARAQGGWCRDNLEGREREIGRSARVVAFGMRWETKLVAHTSERIQVGLTESLGETSRLAFSWRTLFSLSLSLSFYRDYAIASNNKVFIVRFNEPLAGPIRGKQWIADIRGSLAGSRRLVCPRKWRTRADLVWAPTKNRAIGQSARSERGRRVVGREQWDHACVSVQGPRSRV